MARDYQYQQHFLKNPRVVAELVGHTNIRKNDTVYDLGAGSGVISSVLARRARVVIAVESEPQTLSLLTKNLAEHENTEIIKKDILRLKIPRDSYKIFANPPFSLSSDLVRKFMFSNNIPKSLYLIVQKQFASKLVPSDRHFNSQLGAQLWPWFAVRIRKSLKRSDFTPPPAVETVLLEIKPLKEPLLDERYQNSYREFVEECFSRQKFFSSLEKTKIDISPEKKPSEVTPREWLVLFGENGGA